MPVSRLRIAVAAVIIVLLPCGAVSAQQATSCTSAPLSDPPRTVVRCPGGLVIETEAFAQLQILSPAPGGSPNAARVEEKAVLIELQTARPFQIMTPHAIASVRGTTYAVDVLPGSTAVFVTEGEVTVAQRMGADTVRLGPGEGVDVVPGEALTVRRWPQERVSALLSRFGR
jgi:hypothetical protein